jgi:putative ABC transport system permease protein
MRLLFLVWAGLWRKPLRTWLTVLSVAVGFLLFGLLQGLNSAFTAATERTQADRILIGPRFDTPLPMSYIDRIRQIPGIEEVTPISLLRAFYQDPKQRLYVISADPETLFRVHDEYVVDPAQLQALIKTRTALLVLDTFAQKVGWKVGDKVALGSRTLREDGEPWTFDVVGLISTPLNPASVDFAVANYAYVNESRVSPKNVVTRFHAKVADPQRSLTIAALVDKTFANSAVPSRTQTENDFAQSDLALIGDVRAVTATVIGAAFFAILFLTGNVVRQGARERTSEFGTLKALGFSDASVMVLLAAEALVMCLIGAAAGLAGSVAVFPMLSRKLPDLNSYLGTPSLSSSVLALGLVLAVGLTTLSAAVPGWRALRLPVVDALRRRV